MPEFADLIEGFLSEENGSLTLDAPESWSQGRTLYGGMSAALCLVAAQKEIGEDIPLKSALVTFVGPSGGLVKGDATILRKGRSTVIADTVLNTESGMGTRATFVFGKDRDSKIVQSTLDMPDVAAPEECPDLWGGRRRATFANNFDFKRAGGKTPMSGDEKGELLVWVRHNTTAGPNHAAALFAIADALPPASITMFSEPAPISTITWSMEILAPDFDVNDNWFLFESVSEFSANGYSSQAMRLWDREGRPLIAARQNVAVFG